MQHVEPVLNFAEVQILPIFFAIINEGYGGSGCGGRPSAYGGCGTQTMTGGYGPNGGYGDGYGGSGYAPSQGGYGGYGGGYGGGGGAGYGASAAGYGGSGAAYGGSGCGGYQPYGQGGPGAYQQGYGGYSGYQNYGGAGGGYGGNYGAGAGAYGNYGYAGSQGLVIFKPTKLANLSKTCDICMAWHLQGFNVTGCVSKQQTISQWQEWLPMVDIVTEATQAPRVALVASFSCTVRMWVTWRYQQFKWTSCRPEFMI